MTLDKIAVGTEVKIVKVGGEGQLRVRLLDMGLIPNTVVRVQKVAPMGDPIEIHLRGYELTIRKEDAARIEVESKTPQQATGHPICSAAELRGI